MYKEINRCRVCGSNELLQILDLGFQVLTGIFPHDRDEDVPKSPLVLVKCAEEAGGCGLVQLKHTYTLSAMYGDNYGYRSGLNPSMVSHLQQKVRRVLEIADVGLDSLILDIGSNDSTTLQTYPKNGCVLVGIDPTGTKFKQFYPPHIQLIPEFFSAVGFKKHFGERKANVVTSFSMFYDLESPLDFMRDIVDVLDDNGIWVFEQSYMPTMLERNSYDTCCHEHLEYYGLRQIDWMAKKVGLRIVDVEFNDVNGGSFSIVAAKSDAVLETSKAVGATLQRELSLGLDGIGPYIAFAERVRESRGKLRDFVNVARREGKRVAALGASTKGNVLLQYCSFTADDIYAVGEVNPDKFGAFTPGTKIPIIPQNELLASSPDYLLVLPWHFRHFFETNPQFVGRKFAFPLPELEVIKAVGRGA